MPRYTAVLDACALVPIVLGDTLLRVAEKGLYRPLRTDRIRSEAQNDSLITGWEDLEGGLWRRTGGVSRASCPTIPLIDTKKERPDMWLLKRYGLPFMYWSLMLKGRV